MLILVLNDKKFVAYTEAINEARGVFHGITDKFRVHGKIILKEEDVLQKFAKKIGEMGIEIILDEDFSRKKGEEGARLFSVGRSRDKGLDNTLNFTM
ncbi:hypothetical protein KW797_01040 [Candidatus Parcubacteria bacterium]|nr:hypothetical protein [Candidatus Parcubacteria bacterium]